MRMGLAGFLMLAIGAALGAAGYFYLENPLWLWVPGGLMVLVGLALLSGARESALSRFRHRISDSYDRTGDGREK
ncbi:hypothetical protein LYSHEL_14890 [Lysobacter helvus]|uniref:Uncharacterized protein n=2 Tax=Lysobacteraceae TaxID=32033 RepID=A0ABN6FS10_9GAMM|nr:MULTISPECIES: hypothetical protein [Lysobacter]BCT92465.1 hypothetical protein LYSCAS_14890 [Lysobacter caseinilyticus]BCT95618.1 hypothetical protein LYSHEL_14890 [Lysobacter helvus]